MSNSKNITDFLFEVAKLKVTPRAGWFSAGVKSPESIAEHSCSAAFVAFILAKMENADPYKAATIAVMHGLPKTRIHDIDAVGRRYIGKEVEAKITEEQLSVLPDDISEEMKRVLIHGSDEDAEQIIARDADLLEMLIQAKAYKEQGYQNVEHWIEDVPTRLKTDSAKELAMEILKGNSYEWARHLKVLKR